jgi:hypothetical protein
MGKMMDKRKKMIRGTVVFAVCAAIVVAVRAIKRKRRPRISYGPMHERDRQRIEYLNSKILLPTFTLCIYYMLLISSFFCRTTNLISPS